MRAYVVEPVLAVLAVVAAIALLLLAADAVRAERAVADGDARFQSSPGRGDAWTLSATLPGRTSERLLGVDDDLAYRRAIELYARALQPGAFDPERERVRSRAELALTRVSQDDPEPRRRANAANLLGVLVLESVNFVPDETERSRIASAAAGRFRNAIELDAQHELAKRNLEIILRDSPGPTNLVGDTPSGRTGEGSESGVGRAGSGY